MGERFASLRYVAVLVGVLAALVAGVELSRRARTPDAPTPVADPAQPFPRELRDAGGDTLVVPAPPKRIVSQTLATDEILLAICPAERIAALSSLAEDESYSNVAAEAKKHPGRCTQGAEQILKLEPDLIFAASYNRAETVQQLRASRAPVFRFASFNSIADIQANVRTVGHAVGRDAEAGAVVRRMDEALAAVRGRVPTGRPAPRVMSYGLDGFTAGANTTFDDIARAAGAVNVGAANGLDGFAKVSVEKVAEWQPEVIVAGASRGEIEAVRRALLADPVIKATRAGREGRVIVIDNRHFLSVSQNVVHAVEDLADGLYGK